MVECGAPQEPRLFCLARESNALLYKAKFLLFSARSLRAFGGVNAPELATTATTDKGLLPHLSDLVDLSETLFFGHY